MHVIRLRGPWEVEFPFASRDPSRGEPFLAEPGPARLRLPEEAEALVNFQRVATVLLRRRFGRPGNLDSWQRVVLVGQALPPDVEAALNGVPLPTTRAGEEAAALACVAVDVTDRLGARNALETRFAVPASCVGEWRLEIRDAAE